VIVSAVPPAQRHAVLLAQSRPQTNLDAVRVAKAMVAAAADALPAVSMTAQVEAVAAHAAAAAAAAAAVTVLQGPIAQNN
jgi:hypothetical protein